jgi:hypothetical protein
VTTSNWEGSYFLTTCGVSLVADNMDLVNQIQNIFDRDFASVYTHPVSDYFLNDTVLHPT